MATKPKILGIQSRVGRGFSIPSTKDSKARVGEEGCASVPWREGVVLVEAYLEVVPSGLAHLKKEKNH